MRHDIELFPHLLMRVSGGPFESFQRLNLSETMNSVDAICQIQRQHLELKEKISVELHHLIAEIQSGDPGICNLLLKFRRDIFNGRNIPAKIWNQVEPLLPDRLKADLEALDHLKKEETELLEQGGRRFLEELAEARDHLRSLAQDQNLQKGLLLSSQSLLARLHSYLKRDGGLRKKEFQTERSLMKYLARMYAKTSPFSTFTNLALATVNDGGFVPFSVTEGAQPEIRYHIRLNNFLYQYLKGLLLAHPAIGRAVPIRPNPTLRQAGDNYVYLTNSNNIEAFQRIPANPVLEVFQVLSSGKPEGQSIEYMVREILDNEYIDASAGDIENYIEQLVQFGFLEYNFGVSGIDPDWDVRLRQMLEPLADTIPLVRQLIDCLEKVRRLAGEYGDAPLLERREILGNAFALFKGTCMAIHEAAGLPEEERLPAEEIEPGTQEDKDTEDPQPQGGDEGAFIHRSSTVFSFKPEQLFYEDTTSSVDGAISRSFYTEFISTLHHLLQNFKQFEAHLDEQDKMFHFFQRKYPSAGEDGVDLLTFYEDFYREFKKPEAKLSEERKKRQMEGEGQRDRKLEEADERFDIASVKERAVLANRFQERLSGRFKERLAQEESVGDEVRVGLDDITRANEEAGVLPPRWDEHRSYGGFVQFFTQEDQVGGQRLLGVINGTFPGYGRMFSRFLHILPQEVTAALREDNLSLSAGDLSIEDADASYFNANLHPPLMPYEIWMPNGHNSLGPERQIPITQLRVRPDTGAGQLRLLHVPSGKTANVFDLGFQGYRGRSQLFQLLEKFTIAPALFAALVYTAVNAAVKGLRDEDGDGGGEKIRVQPRVIYEDTIVLQRKSWSVPNSLLPLKRPDEDEWNYFCRLNLWREELGMPEEIFLFLVDRRQMERIPPEKRAKLGRDDYKPQYICFTNPFLVNLFERALPRAPGAVKIEEMLPNSRQLLRLGKYRHAIEFVIQWRTRDKT